MIEIEQDETSWAECMHRRREEDMIYRSTFRIKFQQRKGFISAKLKSWQSRFLYQLGEQIMGLPTISKHKHGNACSFLWIRWTFPIFLVPRGTGLRSCVRRPHLSRVVDKKLVKCIPSALRLYLRQWYYLQVSCGIFYVCKSMWCCLTKDSAERTPEPVWEIFLRYWLRDGFVRQIQ